MGESTIPDAQSGGKTYGFPLHQARRIEDTVKRVEATYRNGPPMRRRSNAAAPGFPPIFADSGIGFDAGSRADPSSATVTLLKFAGGANPFGLDLDTGNTVVAHSMFTSAIDASKTILLVYFGGSYYVAQVFECS